MSMPEWKRGPILGRGSTATVSLSSSPSSGDLFAVKSSPLARAEFLQREQRIHSVIASPYIISYLGFDITDEPSGAYYNLFLEYAPGGSLSDVIKSRGGKVSESDVRVYTRDVLLGLAHLHSKNLAHCDVKPRNILIGRCGGAKIADLGCARSLDGDCGHHGRQFMGTPMFMAPEVARGEEQGTEADVWAVGCTVIEMASGRAPWPDATDAVALLHRVGFSGDSPPVPDWISEEGKDFLRKCLKREVKERWSVDELLRHPFLSGSGSGSDSDCKWTSPKSTLERDFWHLFSEEEEEEDIEQVNFERNGPKAIEGLFSNGGGGGGGGGVPDWTWNASWLTVRNGAEETVGDITVVDNSETSTGSSAKRTDISEDCVISSDNCDPVTMIWTSNCETSETSIIANHTVISVNCVISSDNCDAVTMIWTSNWMFPCVPVVNLLLSFALCCVVSSGLIVGSSVVKIFNSVANENKGTRGWRI